MKWPLITRREHDARIRTKDERYGKLAQQVEDQQAEHAKQLAEARADVQRLDGRNKELQRRLDAAHDNQLSESAEAMRLDAEHDARRQALADALGAGPDQSWDELIKLAARGTTGASAEEIEAWEACARAHDRWMPPADLDKRPIGGGTSRPTHPADELRRTQERCLALEARLAVAEGRTRKAVSGS